MAMSAVAVLFFSTSTASCSAFSSEPIIRVLIQRQRRPRSIPVLPVALADNNNGNDDDDGGMSEMFARKVRPPWTARPPPNKKSFLSWSSRNSNDASEAGDTAYNDNEGRRRRTPEGAPSSVNLNNNNIYKHAAAAAAGDDDGNDTVEDNVEGRRITANENHHHVVVVDNRVATTVVGIDGNDLSSSKRGETQRIDNNDDDVDMAASTTTIRKYANRATLLENVLAIKVRQLHVMTNRARLMEDALRKINNERQIMMATTTMATTTTTTQQHHDDDDALDKTAESKHQSAAKVNGAAAATTILDKPHAKYESSTEEELQTMTNRVRLMENTLLQMTNSLQEKEEEIQHERESNVVTVEALQNDILHLNSTIVKLRSQLVELLDEIDELERRRDTEVNDAILSTTNTYKDMIHDMTKEYKVSLLAVDEKWQHQINNKTTDQSSLLLVRVQQEKEEYRKLYKKEVRRRKKEGRKRQEAFQRALLAARIVNDGSSRSRQLTIMSSGNSSVPEQEVDSPSVVDLPILSTVLAITDSSVDDATPATTSNVIAANNNIIDDDFITSTRQREEMLLTDIEELEHDLSVANDRIRELENHLRQTTDDQNKKSEQTQQLHQYLRAQLATYYDTIQEQAVQITNQTKQITNMQRQHDEAMLIATRSVDAARRREEKMLTNIEELENELNTVMAERNDAKELKQKKKEEEEEEEIVVMNMQERLIELEEQLLQGGMREKILIEHNEELSKELIHHVRMANRVKAKLNTRQQVDEEQFEDEDGGDEDITSLQKNRSMQVPQSQQLRRRWLRPWSLIWGR